jgi:hypothetical protein
MKDPEAYANAIGRRWDALDDYREIFDRALAEVRQATEAADHSDSDWRGPAKARQEISEASEKAEGEFWRLVARRAASHAKTVEATAKAYFEHVGARSRKAL